eukprot:GHVH01010631.1.p1 GENE.GHVH01010631.1~~GHVH01010631.1.p1  ORF type:complete len:442 (+),score=52.26 GHVH01010631.1:587-1912(+)
MNPELLKQKGQIENYLDLLECSPDVPNVNMPETSEFGQDAEMNNPKGTVTKKKNVTHHKNNMLEKRSVDQKNKNDYIDAMLNVENIEMMELMAKRLLNRKLLSSKDLTDRIPGVLNSMAAVQEMASNLEAYRLNMDSRIDELLVQFLKRPAISNAGLLKVLTKIVENTRVGYFNPTRTELQLFLKEYSGPFNRSDCNLVNQRCQRSPITGVDMALMQPLSEPTLGDHDRYIASERICVYNPCHSDDTFQNWLVETGKKIRQEHEKRLIDFPRPPLPPRRTISELMIEIRLRAGRGIGSSCTSSDHNQPSSDNNRGLASLASDHEQSSESVSLASEHDQPRKFVKRRRVAKTKSSSNTNLSLPRSPVGKRNPLKSSMNKNNINMASSINGPAEPENIENKASATRGEDVKSRLISPWLTDQVIELSDDSDDNDMHIISPPIR